MKKLTIAVENLKCNGCENTVHNALMKLKGVIEVEVKLETSIINLSYTGDKEAIEKKLRQLGYPKKGSGNALQTAKSYVSCAMGKFSDKAVS